MRNSGWNKLKNPVVQTGWGPASSPFLASGLYQQKWELSSSNVFAVQAFVCIYSEFRACFHCWSRLPPRADSKQKYPASWPDLPAVKQYKGGKKSPYIFQACCAGPAGLPGSCSLGAFCPCSRCVADMPRGCLLTAVRSWSGTMWRGALVPPGAAWAWWEFTVPVWFLFDISKLQMTSKQVPLWCQCVCLICGYHMQLESLHLCALHQLGRKAVKENLLLYYTQISTSEIMGFGSSV